VINNEWTWKSTDGLEMYAQSWRPEGTPKAVVCLVHGLGEHSSRYANVGKAFAKAGFALVAFDLRGHGKSGGQRGHFPSLDIIMKDIHQLIQQGSEKLPGLPVFLYGHSLGGLLVLNYATYQKQSLSGVIATGAGLRSPVLEQKAKIALSKVLGSLLPTMTIPTGLDANGISRNPEVVRAYKNDPLVHDVATLSAARIGISAVDRAFSHAGEFSTPLLLMHGTADQVTYPHGSQEFAALVPESVTLKQWDGLYHEIHNEPEQEEVFAFMIDWMNSQLRNK
jgi:alpha-beta hydrolase superfamily lysophospholipase